jgi:Ca2+-binding EF-hand superfamily protein
VTHAKIKAAFTYFDKDGDGYITTAEVQQVRVCLGAPRAEGLPRGCEEVQQRSTAAQNGMAQHSTAQPRLDGPPAAATPHP